MCVTSLLSVGWLWHSELSFAGNAEGGAGLWQSAGNCWVVTVSRELLGCGSQHSVFAAGGFCM